MLFFRKRHWTTVVAFDLICSYREVINSYFSQGGKNAIPTLLSRDTHVCRVFCFVPLNPFVTKRFTPLMKPWRQTSQNKSSKLCMQFAERGSGVQKRAVSCLTVSCTSLVMPRSLSVTLKMHILVQLETEPSGWRSWVFYTNGDLAKSVASRVTLTWNEEKQDIVNVYANAVTSCPYILSSMSTLNQNI
jgi:hypothetical protein